MLVSEKAGREDPREEERLSLLGCQALGFVLKGEACRWALPGRLARRASRGRAGARAGLPQAHSVCSVRPFGPKAGDW